MAKIFSRSNHRASISIHESVYLDLESYCKALGIPVSAKVDQLINDFIGNEYKIKDEIIAKLDELVSLHKGTLSEE